MMMKPLSGISAILAVSYGCEGSKINPILRDLEGTGFRRKIPLVCTSYFGAAKYKRKAIKFVNKPWSLKQKQKGNSKFDEQINKLLYNWIMHNPQVVQSPIVNYCLKVKIDVQN